jgi:hypothetical protein
MLPEVHNLLFMLFREVPTALLGDKNHLARPLNVIHDPLQALDDLSCECFKGSLSVFDSPKYFP